MKRPIILFFVSIFTVLQAQTPHTWTSTNGHSFEGVLLRMDASSVTLRGTNGKEVTVPKSVLDEASLKLAEREYQQLISGASVFTHSNRHLRFSLYPDKTWLKMQFVQGSQIVNNETYELTFQLSEVHPGNSWKSVRVKGLNEDVKKDRNKVTMQILMTNGVVVEFVVALNDKAELSYEYDVVEIPEGLPRIDMRTMMSFPKLLEYDMESQSYTGQLSQKGIFFNELPEFFKGYDINVDSLGDSSVSKILYSDKQTSGINAQKFTVNNPRKKSLQFEAPKNIENGNLFIWFYSGKAPFEGFTIRALNREQGRHHAGPFTISLN